MIPVSRRLGFGRLAPVAHEGHGADPFVLFAVEGALFQLFTSVNGFGNNLFATELGATDLQIGLIQTVPNVAAVLLLLPLGILADRLRSSRTIPLVSLLFVAAGYVLMSMVPGMGGLRIPAFFFALAFTTGGPVLYNAQWQTFFGDVVHTNARNDVLTLRNRLMFAVGIAVPLIGGAAMTGRLSTLRVIQLFFAICAIAVLAQAAVISAIHPPQRRGISQKFTRGELTDAMKALASSREFLMFFVPVVLFYMTWQMDWSMWYIGQAQYLHLTESQLTISSGIFNVGQLVAIGVLSGIVRKKGTDRTLPYAALGLMFCPLIMMFCMQLPQTMRMSSFTLLLTVLNAPQCATNLCIVQILLRVAPQKCRSIAVSIYTLTVTLSNCFMPYLGVALYTAMGADYSAIMRFNLILFVVRLAAYCLLLARCRYVKE